MGDCSSVSEQSSEPPGGGGGRNSTQKELKGSHLCSSVLYGDQQLVSSLFGLTSLETFTGGLFIDKEHTVQPTRSWEFCDQGFWCRICPVGTSPIAPQMCCCLGGEIVVALLGFLLWKVCNL